MMSLLGDETARFIKAHNKEELEYHDRAWRTTAVQSRGARDFIVTIPVDGNVLRIDGDVYESRDYVYDRDFHVCDTRGGSLHYTEQGGRGPTSSGRCKGSAFFR